MIYLTQILGRPVLHPDGERFGKIAEVIVAPADPLPVVAAYQVKTGDGALFIPADALPLSGDAGAKGAAYTLRRPITDIAPYQIAAQDFSLVRDVLDKQIVDVHDYRVVRVNDVRLDPLQGGAVVLAGVDAGVRGLLRRMGMEGAAEKVSALFGRRGASVADEASLIAWQDVASLPTHNTGEPLKLRVSYEKLARLHPAEIGEILNQMDPASRREVLETLDIETAADALAEADDEVQVSALQTLDEERAADILDEMPADEAADVLGDMDLAHREDLLGRMEAEEREEVEELLPYDDKTAGGLMTKEYVVIPETHTAQQTIDALRTLEPDAETIYYIYVTDPDERLVGVISLRDLIIAAPNTQVSTFMISNVRSVETDAKVEEVAHTFERFKLLALPVVDTDNRLQGIITIDDTLEQLLPPNWRKRPAA